MGAVSTPAASYEAWTSACNASAWRSAYDGAHGSRIYANASIRNAAANDETNASSTSYGRGAATSYDEAYGAWIYANAAATKSNDGAASSSEYAA